MSRIPATVFHFFSLWTLAPVVLFLLLSFNTTERHLQTSWHLLLLLFLGVILQEQNCLTKL